MKVSSLLRYSIIAANSFSNGQNTCNINTVQSKCANWNFDHHQEMLNVYPRYHMEIKNIQYAAAETYDVTIRAYANENIALKYLHSLKIIGVQGPQGTIQLWGANEGVTPQDFVPSDFTSTFKIYANANDNPCNVELPSFQIQYEYNYSDEWAANGWGQTHFDLMVGCGGDNQGNSNFDFPAYVWPKDCDFRCGGDSSSSYFPISTSSKNIPSRPSETTKTAPPESATTNTSESATTNPPESVTSYSSESASSYSSESVHVTSYSSESASSYPPESVHVTSYSSESASSYSPESVTSYSSESATTNPPESVTSYSSESASSYSSEFVHVTSYSSESASSYPPESASACSSESVTSYPSESVTSYSSESVTSYQSRFVTSYSSESVTSYQSRFVTSYSSESVTSYPSESASPNSSGSVISVKSSTDEVSSTSATLFTVITEGCNSTSCKPDTTVYTTVGSFTISTYTTLCSVDSKEKHCPPYATTVGINTQFEGAACNVKGSMIMILISMLVVF